MPKYSYISQFITNVPYRRIKSLHNILFLPLNSYSRLFTILWEHVWSLWWQCDEISCWDCCFRQFQHAVASPFKNLRMRPFPSSSPYGCLASSLLQFLQWPHDNDFGCSGWCLKHSGITGNLRPQHRLFYEIQSGAMPHYWQADSLSCDLASGICCWQVHLGERSNYETYISHASLVWYINVIAWLGVMWDWGTSSSEFDTISLLGSTLVEWS